MYASIQANQQEMWVRWEGGQEEIINIYINTAFHRNEEEVWDLEESEEGIRDGIGMLIDTRQVLTWSNLPTGLTPSLP